MSSPTNAIDEISKIFLTTIQKTLETGTGQVITFSSTIQDIPRVSMKPDVTSFVQFEGDYTGLVILNFSAEAAFAMEHTQFITLETIETQPPPVR
ncbi:MAG: DUF3334 family protein [Desulfobacteraceae bacterium]|nr:DUF3334 family protein [Desulfobacteraceae bacterium]